MKLPPVRKRCKWCAAELPELAVREPKRGIVPGFGTRQCQDRHACQARQAARLRAKLGGMR